MFSKNKIHKAFFLSAAFFLSLLTLLLSSCIDDGDAIVATAIEQENASLPELKLSFVIPNANVATRADYESGEGLENQINISDHDFRVYFFTYDVNDENYEKGGTLLAEFTPTRTTSSSSQSETRYTVTGKVPEDLLAVDSFRVVVLANWGNVYPTSFSEDTTIDNLTDSEFSTFTAQNKFELSASNLIPFYGVQEFSGVKIEEGQTTTLPTAISLLRALAKVEIILDDDEDNEFSFSSVTLHNYNATGYSAPASIYLSEDYDHNGDWENDYVESLHLYGNANDTQGKTTNFIKTKERVVDATTGAVTQYETWELYIPEYNNMGEDYSYISTVLSDDSEGDTIYFAMYVEGKTNAYDDGADEEDIANRLNIHRNNLYRFHVSRNKLYTSVDVVEIIPWVERLDNVGF